MQASAFHRHVQFIGRLLAVAFTTAFFFSIFNEDLYAQAKAAAERTAELSAFALYHRLDPDYGRDTNHGVVFGLDYMRYPNWWIKPGIEFRGKYAPGSTVTQSALGGGVRLEKPMGYFHPYANVLFSASSIKYNFTPTPILPNGKPYTSDGTITYSLGGGVDVDAWHDFALRADFQYEWWRLDKYTPIYLNPHGFSIGLVYRIPFRNRR